MSRRSSAASPSSPSSARSSTRTPRAARWCSSAPRGSARPASGKPGSTAAAPRGRWVLSARPSGADAQLAFSGADRFAGRHRIRSAGWSACTAAACTSIGAAPRRSGRHTRGAARDPTRAVERPARVGARASDCRGHRRRAMARRAVGEARSRSSRSDSTLVEPSSCSPGDRGRPACSNVRSMVVAPSGSPSARSASARSGGCSRIDSG